MSAIHIRVIDNSQAFTRGMKEDTLRILEMIGENAVQNARTYVPYDTGHLHDSIYWDRNDRAVTLHAGEEYAAYVECGTIYQAAQPYLRPAIENHQEEYKELAESIYRGEEVISPHRRIVYDND